MPMSPRLLRPRASGVHPEAADWRSRVVANGGTVSTTTLRAVDQFCKSIDSAGIRSLFARLSLMCGGSLEAALVPLYRGTSLSGTQYGGNDTNYNFVSGDYAETGSSSGLQGNGSTKALLTPLTGNDLGDGYNIHCSVYWRGTDPVTTARWCGSFNGPVLMCETSGNSVGGRSGDNVFMSATITSGSGNQQGHHITSRTSASDSRHFKDGSSIVQRTATVTVTPGSTRFAVFAAALDNVGGFNSIASRRILAYSFGAGMTTTQAAAYYTALQAFQVTMGRT